MGVMGCNRKDCDNIMCDKYSTIYGYICWECFDELVGKHMKISKFMKSSKTHDSAKPRHTEESLSKEFK